ncbi:MBL fold metallo-hydrolase [Sphingobium sp.]|uniref:MBL fold metallo-hydrolase n=1 Tax=Sphingobium sp. TaxID=1912891 RepID=UPI002B6CD16C|nr:MBL fold metallo-hydrolase [Sphingobium sp.]HUD93863.1 MBL fold metallo-hydrolase [Sphingobium sp.]
MAARYGMLIAAILGFSGVAIEPALAAPACPPLRWTTLGTAGGPVPTADRSEPSNLLVAGDQTILVDTGDGTVNQLARIGMDMRLIRTVFISHLHLDHSGGLGAVIGLRWMNQFPGQLTIYGPPGIRQVVDGIVASMAPPARIGFGLGALPPAPAGSVRAVELRDGQSITLDGGVTVKAAANSHFDHDGKADPANISLSYRFALGDRSITYTGDTGPSAAVATLATGSDMLVSEVIDLERLMKEIRQRRVDASAEMLASMQKHLSTHHLLAADIGHMAAGAKVGRVVLTHYAVPGLLSESEPSLRADIGKAYVGPVDLSRDLSSFDLGCR